jgi:hypothetical protein
LDTKSEVVEKWLASLDAASPREVVNAWADDAAHAERAWGLLRLKWILPLAVEALGRCVVAALLLTKDAPPGPYAFFMTQVQGTQHRVEITALRPGYLEWLCATCKAFGYTTAGYDGAPLVRQARTGHYQQARRIARKAERGPDERRD